MHPSVAQDALRGAISVMKQHGPGGDVVLANNVRREVAAMRHKLNYGTLLNKLEEAARQQSRQIFEQPTIEKTVVFKGNVPVILPIEDD